jgi:hypothetical protein
MRLYRAVLLISWCFPTLAWAQSEFGAPDGARVPAAVIECATSNPTVALPCGIQSAPLKIDQGSTAVVPPGGGSGVLGFLAGIYNVLTAGLVVGGTVSTTDTGTAVRNATMPSGGSGVTGWLSAIWSALSGTLSVSVGNWPATQSVSGTVTAAPASASPVDCSATLATSGTAYQIVAAGTAKKAVLMQNLGSSNLGFSLTSASPAIGTAGTFTLVPNASVQLAPGMITSNAIYAVGSAASQPLACTLFQ